jgi:hypothetical protein
MLPGSRVQKRGAVGVSQPTVRAGGCGVIGGGAGVMGRWARTSRSRSRVVAWLVASCGGLSGLLDSIAGEAPWQLGVDCG